MDLFDRLVRDSATRKGRWISRARADGWDPIGVWLHSVGLDTLEVLWMPGGPFGCVEVILRGPRFHRFHRLPVEIVGATMAGHGDLLLELASGREAAK